MISTPVLLKQARTVLSMAAVAMTLTMTVAEAQNWSSGSRSFSSVADGRLVDVQVQVDGNTAPLYFASRRFDRHYFQAFRGRNYSLVVRNNTGRRVGVLIAVDGLNVVNGQRSSLSNHESMNVLDPYEQAVIRGWRTSLHNVRRFVFVDEERSYAERTGQANGDMGWIRVLSFQERRPHTWFNEPKLRDRDDEIVPFGQEMGEGELDKSAPSQPPSSDLRAQKPAPGESKSYGSREESNSNPGTGWGDSRFDPVQRTRFLAVSHATDRIVLRYEYASGLRALGIRIHNRDRLWDRERGELGFAQPPKW